MIVPYKFRKKVEEVFDEKLPGAWEWDTDWGSASVVPGIRFCATPDFITKILKPLIVKIVNNELSDGVSVFSTSRVRAIALWDTSRDTNSKLTQVVRFRQEHPTYYPQYGSALTTSTSFSYGTTTAATSTPTTLTAISPIKLER